MDFLDRLRQVNAERKYLWLAGADVSPLYFSNELGGEIGEVQNVVKKLERAKLNMRGTRATLDDLADELADGLICLDNLAECYGIDLKAATVRKFNETSAKNGFTQTL
jgi:NTP pyrophosphatase (non-canonical NTP hydrolase)